MINPRPSRVNANIPEGKSGRPFYGVDPGLMDENGNLVNSPGQSGHLVIRQPWPGMARTIHNNHARYKDRGPHTNYGRWRRYVGWVLNKDAYFEQYPGYYASGDGAIVDEDGFYQVIGRRDDVINVAGHRLRTVWLRSQFQNIIMVTFKPSKVRRKLKMRSRSIMKSLKWLLSVQTI